jgi:methionine synthase II (cobalamin-independent)
MHNYSFYFNDNIHTEHTVGMQIVVSDGQTWHKVVESFLNFLETVYGYPLKDGVLYVDETQDIHPSRTVTAYLENINKPEPYSS